MANEIIHDPVDYLWECYRRAQRRNVGAARKLLQRVADMCKMHDRAKRSSSSETYKETAGDTYNALRSELDGIARGPWPTRSPRASRVKPQTDEEKRYHAKWDDIPYGD